MKISTKLILLFGAPLATAILASSLHAQILLNPSFELNSVGSTAVNSWTINAAASALIVDGTGVTHGSNALQITLPSGGDYVSRVEQFRSEAALLGAGLVSGQTYLFTGDVTVTQLGSSTALRPAIFLEIGTGTNGSNFTAGASSFSLSFLYSGGYVIFQPIQGGVYGTDFIGRLDNLQVTPIPEPSTTATLMGILACCLIVCRRRGRAV